MTTMLFQSSVDKPERWVPELQRQMPELELRIWPDVGDVTAVDYALVFEPPEGMLAGLPNLKVIFSLAAGVDHILRDPSVPPEIPVVRMVDDNLRAMMTEYATLAVLYYHRYLPEYFAQQAEKVWETIWPAYTPDTAVGVLGLGAIGRDVAGRLAAFGFQVHGWSRTEKSVEGITCHWGDEGLRAMLGRSKYLVCVLPLTAETRGIINAQALAALPPGACVVNIGRGGHVVDNDLLAALDSGHLRGAFLDVFRTEPLPPEHRYWSHPKVRMTPHNAGEIVPRSAAKRVIENLRRHLAGEPLPNRLERGRGY